MSESKALRLDCDSDDCIIARNSGGSHEVRISTDDESISLYEDTPGNYVPNQIGYRGPETEIVGTLLFDCPDSKVHNQKTYVGEKGKIAMGTLATNGIVPVVV